jgi:hypothetical protein
MDHMSDASDVLATSRSATLVRTADGYEVHRAGSRTVDRFPDTDDGSDDAWDRFHAIVRVGRIDRIVAGLLTTSLVSAVAWIVCRIGTAFTYAWLLTGRDPNGHGIPDLYPWISAAEQVTYAVFLGATGCYVLLWLQRAKLLAPRSSR